MVDRRKVLLGLLSCPLCASVTRAGSAHWEYEGVHGAQSWAELDGSFKACGIGDQQSPIDIKSAITAISPPIEIDWRPQAFEIVNNGHTIQANVAPGSTLGIGAEKYELKQFHFHTPSEHALDGMRTAMEAHFVHTQESGRIAVVGAFMIAGATNDAFARIMAAAPAHEGETRLKGAIDARTLIPKEGRRFRYEGSLTTPPCSEVVDWNLFHEPITVAEADIDAFKKLFPNNARPLQPVNRRFVLQSN